MTRWRWLFGLLVGALAFGSAQDWKGRLAALQGYPALEQARLGVEAAREGLKAVLSPVSLSAQGGVSALTSDPPPSTCATPPPGLPPELGPVLGQLNPECYPLPGSASQVQATLTFTPLPFGPLAAQARQAQANLRLAELTYRQARASLEREALLADARLLLAQEALGLAQEGERLAEEALRATQLRLERGGATPLDLKDAETKLQEAQLNRFQAERNLTLAQASLKDLLGDPTPFPLPELKLPQGKAYQVLQAELNREKALAGVEQAQSNLYPILQVGYTYYPTAYDSLSVSLQSLTLQPQVSYVRQSSPRTPPQDRLRGQATLGLSLNLSPGTLSALDAAKAQLQAAEQALELAGRQAALQEASLRNGLEYAHRALELARQEEALAQEKLQVAQAREAAGLAAPLATLQASLDRYQAVLRRAQAELSYLQSLLDLYVFYALTPSEVNP